MTNAVKISKENNTPKQNSNNNNNEDNKNVQDDVSKYYNRINFFERILKFIFISNLFLLIPSIINFKFQNLCFGISIVLSIIYVIITKAIDIYLKNRAEIERRKTFIKNSFNADITTNNTYNYYNNEEKESIRKMGVNCFENTFFTKFILDKMVFEETLKIFIVFLFYFVLLTQTKSLKGLALLFGQTLFFLEYFFKFIRFQYFRTQVNHIYDQLYDIFIISTTKKENIFTARVLDAIMNYECLKYYCKISLSSKIFNKYNPVLSKKWDDLYHKKIEEYTVEP